MGGWGRLRRRLVRRLLGARERARGRSHEREETLCRVQRLHHVEVEVEAEVEVEVEVGRWGGVEVGGARDGVVVRFGPRMRPTIWG